MAGARPGVVGLWCSAEQLPHRWEGDSPGDRVLPFGCWPSTTRHGVRLSVARGSVKEIDCCSVIVLPSKTWIGEFRQVRLSLVYRRSIKKTEMRAYGAVS